MNHTSILYNVDVEAAPSSKNKKGEMVACFICGNEVKILNINREKRELTYECSKCDKNKGQKEITISVDKYLELMNNYSDKFNICSECSKKMKEEKDWKFCVHCKCIICPSCVNSHISNSRHNCTENSLMNNSDKRIKCLKHPKDFGNENKYFCHSHKTHFCNLCITKTKEKIHKKGKCQIEDLLLSFIGEDEEEIFKNKVNSLKKKEKELNEERDEKKKKLKLQLEEDKLKAKNQYAENIEKNNKNKNIEIEKIDAKIRNEQEQIIKEYKRKLEKKIEEITNEINKERESDILKLNEKYHKLKEKKVKNNKNINEKESLIYNEKLKKCQNKYNEEISKLNNDKTILNLNGEINLLELIERDYEQNKENYYNLSNYLFVINEWNQEETPNQKHEENQIINNHSFNKDNKDEEFINDKEIEIKFENNMNSFNRKPEKKEFIKSEKISLNLNNEDNNINNFITNNEEKKEITEPIFVKTEIIGEKTLTENYDNTFEVFNSINNQSFLIYVTENNSIMLYNLTYKTEQEIGIKHTETIIGFRHFYDKDNKRDLIMSISQKDNNIKIWDINNWNRPICDLKDFNISGNILSSCFLYDNSTYIVTSSDKDDSIKIYDLNCNLIKEIDNSNEQISYLDTYYDDNNNNIFIIAGCKRYTKSYDYHLNKEYKKYEDKCKNNTDDYIVSAIVFRNKEYTQLIDSQNNGIIRIWDLLMGHLTFKLNMETFIAGICLWNENYLFVGCSDKTIKLISIDEGEPIKQFYGHNEAITTVKKIKIGKHYSLFSQGKNDKIIKWKFN